MSRVRVKLTAINCPAPPNPDPPVLFVHRICRNPGPIARTSGALAVATPPRLPAGMPSALLERRPDVLAAEEQIRSADANRNNFV